MIDGCPWKLENGHGHLQLLRAAQAELNSEIVLCSRRGVWRVFGWCWKQHRVAQNPDIEGLTWNAWKHRNR